MADRITEQINEAYKACGFERGRKLTFREQVTLTCAHLRIIGADEGEVEHYGAPLFAAADRMEREAREARMASNQGRLPGF